ncbi:MAG: hypothetical protein R3Y63_10795 [Eubacteriales bacterium]
MKKYRICILSNCQGSGLKDDSILKEAFEEDGHEVSLETVFYDEGKDDTFDIIIRRNTWVSKEEDTDALYEQNQKLVARLTQKEKKTVNLMGHDGAGKGYLCDLFSQGYGVIPTINTLSKVELLPDVSTYVLKNIKSFGNGLHQKFVGKEDLSSPDHYKEGDIIQPKLDFTSEIQCYYVGNQSVYTLEYTPSKFPHYPEPKFITLTAEEQAQADVFAQWSGLVYGFQRVDFLRLADGSLLMMEIEDHAAFMNIQRLPEPLLSEVLSLYKENIYTALEA